MDRGEGVARETPGGGCGEQGQVKSSQVGVGGGGVDVFGNKAERIDRSGMDGMGWGAPPPEALVPCISQR